MRSTLRGAVLVAAVAAATFALAACGGDSGGGATKASADTGKLSDKPMTLTNGFGDWNTTFADYKSGSALS